MKFDTLDFLIPTNKVQRQFDWEYAQTPERTSWFASSWGTLKSPFRLLVLLTDYSKQFHFQF